MKKMKRIVLKFGTSSITNNTRTLYRPNIIEFVRQVALLHREGVDLAIVSSGAVAAGRELLNHPSLPKDLPAKQMFASVGQSRLIHLWAEMLSYYDIFVGQLLLTRGDLISRKSYLNIRDTLTSLISRRVIPIINENDSVATEEMRLGDNDNLSARIANLMGAELLLLLTDQEGLFDKNPASASDAKLIGVVDNIDDSVFSLARGTGALGTGGMATKIEAAQIAVQSGIPTVIAKFSERDVILRIAAGEAIGTLFPTKLSPKESRRRWLFSEKPQGALFVDEGAARKLVEEGASLLPVGIIRAEGEFDRGALLKVFSSGGEFIAVGISAYSKSEIDKIAGIRSALVRETLGYSYGDAVIHRDNMAGKR